MKGFLSYKSGVYNGASECHFFDVNHVVAIVGYGTETIGNTTIDYWKIRNSWGPSWGEKGMGKLIRNKNHVCGIAFNVWCAIPPK